MNDLNPQKPAGGMPRRRRRRSRRFSGQPVTSTTISQENPPKKEKPKPRVSNQNNRGTQRSKPQEPAKNDQRKPTNQKLEKREGKAHGDKRRRPRGNPARNNPKNQQGRGYKNSKIPTVNEVSAGGLVVSGLAEAVTDNGEIDLSRMYVALIGRLDRRNRLLWSMPKGHVEPGEDKATTAEREVWEETGIRGEVFAALGVIDYWFVSEGKRIHKTVHHHLLRYIDGDLNDEDPEATEVAWVPVTHLIEYLAFADERKLARKAHQLLPEYARAEKATRRVTPR